MSVLFQETSNENSKFINRRLSMNYKVTYYVFHSVCSFATILFLSYCLYEYSLNEDISQVTFQEFHKNEKNIYPSLTVCLSSIFLEDKFVTHGQGINLSTYTEYLYGEHWDDRMIDVDYDNVTTKFEDYLQGVALIHNSRSRRIERCRGRWWRYN